MRPLLSPLGLRLAAALFGPPAATFGRLLGAAARCPIPRPLRPRVYGAYVRRYGVDLAEAALPLEEYRSLNALFTRRLEPAARPLDQGPDLALMPADGVLAESGIAQGDRLLQAKGVGYRIADLLGDQQAAATFEGGAYATVYLSPRDYHRVHSPVDGQVVGCHHIPGRFSPVFPAAARRLPDLFSANERLVTFLESGSFGPLALVMIAALGVGHITVTYDDQIATHRPVTDRPPIRRQATHQTATRRRGGRSRRQTYQPGRAIARGAELGRFNLGSTVVVLFARGRAELLRWRPGDRVRVGQALARLVRASDGTRAALLGP